MRFWDLCRVNTVLPSPTKPLLKSLHAEGYLSMSFEGTGALLYGGTQFRLMGWVVVAKREHRWVAGGRIARLS